MQPIVLMVAEKPSVAETIAQKLSPSKPHSRKALNGIPVHEWDGTFKNQRVSFRMTAVTGHVFGMDFPPKYNSWDKVDPADLFECPTMKTEANEKQRVPIMLKAEARHVSYVILWLDCDKEGENICFEVTDILSECMRLTPGQNLFRAKFSALTTPDLKKAMDTLTIPNENESRSVDARQELDLRIGCCFTRFQTKIFHGKYGSLDSALISYGPCQTPTLGFCVKRHDAIQQFKPEKFWGINISVTLGEKEISLNWSRSRLFDKEAVEFFLHSMKESKTAKVIDCTKKECAKKRPLGLNTVELLRLASSRLGFSPHHTMQVAERLYTQGYISYPRTETTHYPENFDIRGVLSKFSKHDEWSSYVSWDGIVKPLKGHDAGDHSPITPVMATSSSSFHDSDAARLYDFVVRHFISTVTEDCAYLETNITFKIQNELFTFVGKEIINPGFTKVYPFNVFPSSSDEIPQVTVNSTYPISEKKLYESETKPPDYLTESELISLMETHGIGTDASIPVHLNNVVQRNYVKLLPGRKLAPTELGIILVHGYLKIDPELVLPTMRAELEKQLDLIAKGAATIQSVLQHTLDIFKAKFLYFVKNIMDMDELFEVSFSKFADTGKPFSRCGKCRRYMKLVLSRLHCQTCQDTYSVPSDGTLRAFNENRCPLDDFELVEFTSGKSYVFCPYCINHPPFDGMRKGNGCNNCSHPTCPYGYNSKTIAQCSECEGLLVVDPASGPKWKISCNQCNVFLVVQCKKLSVLEDTCNNCSSQNVMVDDKKGCLFCTDEFECNVEKHRVMDQRRGGGGGRGGRGRGRGRGRRGRGRGH